MATGITISYNSTSFTSEYVIDSFKLTEVFHNDLSPADNSISLQIPYREDIANFIKTNNNVDLQAVVRYVIYNSGEYTFYGFIRNNYTFEKQQRIQPISLEIVSPSFLLKRNIGSEIIWANKTPANVVRDLLLHAGLTNYAAVITNTDLTDNTIIFKAGADETYYDVITQLLFEYGYVFDFYGNNGTFRVLSLFNYPSATAGTFNGNNIRDSIKQIVSPENYTGVRINWKSALDYDNILLWETREGETAIHDCVVPIQPNSTWGGNNGMELKYDSGLGEIVYVSSITPTLKFDNGDEVGITQKSITNQGTYASAIITNSSSKVKNITKFQIYGHAFLRADSNITVNQVNDKNVLELEFEYLADSNRIKNITAKINEYYNKADFTFTLSSMQNYAVGSLVNVSELGIGSTTARITKRDYSYNKAINYSLEAIKDISFNITSTNENIVDSKNSSNPRTLGDMAGIIGTIGDNTENGKPENYWVLEDLAYLQEESEDGTVIYKKGDFFIGDNDNYIQLAHNKNGKVSLSLKADSINITALGTEVIGTLRVIGTLIPDALIIPTYTTDPADPKVGQIWLRG
jgi:hypothetical protein